MNKWEYINFYIHGRSKDSILKYVEESAGLGEDGWELVTINYCNDYRE